MVTQDSDRLRHRRQFVLGPRPLEECAHWRTSFVGPYFVLQAHPDLPLRQLEHARIHLTLLGYVLDPLAPEHDDETILRELASRASTAHDVARAAAELAGRWIMIADDGHDLILFHDPCGLREVYHTSWDQPETWCASQPDRLASVLDLEIGETQRDYFASAYFNRAEEPWMPGTASPYDEVRHLTPNHWLDLNTREVRRYWPHGPIRELELEEGAHLAAQLLRENLRAASLRFPLALSLTAGMDSRTLLAASRGISDVLHYTAACGDRIHEATAADLPARVLRRLGLDHHVVECPPRADAMTETIQNWNTPGTSRPVAAISQGLIEGLPDGHVQVNACCSEIVRDVYGVAGELEATPESLASLMDMRGEPFCIDQIEMWLAQIGPGTAGSGLRTWDLFFMEQDCGRRAANDLSRWDLVHDRFAPFNHRGLITALLGIDPAHRQGPGFAAQRRMMEILWPDVLLEPFAESTPSLTGRPVRICRELREHGVRRTISKGVRRILAP